MNEKIEELKRDGATERLRREINSVAWSIKQTSEQIVWNSSQPEVHIANIRINLDYLTEIFNELNQDEVKQ